MVQISNSPHETTIIQAEARKSFAFGVWIYDSNQNAVDLGGSSLTLVAAKVDRYDNATIVINTTAELVSPMFGHARFNLQAADLDLAKGEYQFVVTMHTAGYSNVLLRGTLEVLPNPELASVGETYSVSSPAQSLQVVLQRQPAVHVELGHALPPDVTRVPPGGATGQALVKGGNSDWQLVWSSLEGGLAAEGQTAFTVPTALGDGTWEWQPVSWANISGKPTTFPPIVGTGAADAKAGNWFPAWTEVTSKPTTFAPIIGTTGTTAKAGNWFPAWSEITSTVVGTTDWTPLRTTGRYVSSPGATGVPSGGSGYWAGEVYLASGGGGYIQSVMDPVAVNSGTPDVYYRYWNGSAWSAWTKDTAAWAEITGKPTTFAPDPTVAVTRATSSAQNADSAIESGYYHATAGSTNYPWNNGYWALEVINVGNRSIQTAYPWTRPEERWTRYRNLPGDGTFTDWVPMVNRGWTAMRDSMFGVPTTDAQRVALANQRILWYNTDLGWWESYYAVTGTAGLTARGLVNVGASFAPAGWYPIGPGPRIRLIASGSQSVSGTNQTITAWSAPGTGQSTRVGGTAWFTYASGVITLAKAGRYRISFRTRVTSGGGTAWIYLNSNNMGNLGIANFTLNAAFQNPEILIADHNGVATETIRAYSDSGSYVLNEGGNGAASMSGELVVEYIGPYLTSN